MIICLSDLVSMCKIQKNSYFQTRPERLVYICMKELKYDRHYERGLFVCYYLIEEPIRGKCTSVRHKNLHFNAFSLCPTLDFCYLHLNTALYIILFFECYIFPLSVCYILLCLNWVFYRDNVKRTSSFVKQKSPQERPSESISLSRILNNCNLRLRGHLSMNKSTKNNFACATILKTLISRLF